MTNFSFISTWFAQVIEKVVFQSSDLRCIGSMFLLFYLHLFFKFNMVEERNKVKPVHFSLVSNLKAFMEIVGIGGH